MLTINAEIKSDGKRLDGTYNVKLRFTLDRKMRRQGTSLFATPSDLTKDLRIKQSSPLKREVDSLIREMTERRGHSIFTWSVLFLIFTLCISECSISNQ